MNPLPFLTQFTDDWTSTQRRRAALLSAIIAAPIAILTGLWMGGIFTQADTSQYLALAANQPAALPFASRQLGPLIVRGLVQAFHISIPAAFYVEGAVSWIIFLATALWFLLRSGAPRILFAATLGMFFWARQFNLLVMPDLLYAALLAIFLLLLERRRFLLAGLMMFPLTVSRESTILTLLCFLIAGWRRLRIPEAALAIISFLAGSVLVRHLAANALPNSEHISPTLYLFAKMPWAFLKNFLGLYPWSNVYPECAVPQWQTAFHFGPVKAIGICGFVADPPEQLIFYLLASFGLFPLLLLMLTRRKHFPWPLMQSRARDSVLMRFALIYGVLSFVMAGLLGESFQRLLAYSWPLFLTALPAIMAKAGATFRSNAAAVAFLVIHLLICWSAIQLFQPTWIPAQLALWLGGYLLLRRTLIFAPGVFETPTNSRVAVTNSAI